MAKAAGGLRSFAASRGYRVRKLTGNRTSGGQYRYAMGKADGRGGMNMRARNASDAINLIRSSGRAEAAWRARTS